MRLSDAYVDEKQREERKGRHFLVVHKMNATEKEGEMEGSSGRLGVFEGEAQGCQALMPRIRLLAS